MINYPRLPLLSPSTRARARPWSARCYGVARQRDRSRQNSRGPRACFLSGISGSRVGAEESGAASFDLLVSAARCGATGSGRYAADRAGEPLHRAPPRSPLLSPSTRARARPWSARCYGVARQRDRPRPTSRGPRACFLSGISGSRVGAEESGAASLAILGRAVTYRASGSVGYAEERLDEAYAPALRLTNAVIIKQSREQAESYSRL